MREEIYNFGTENDVCYDEYGNIIPCPTTGGNQFDIPKEWIKEDLRFPESLTPVQGEWAGGTMVVDEPQKEVEEPILYLYNPFTHIAKRDQTILEQNYSTIDGYKKDLVNTEYTFVNNVFFEANQIPKVNGSPINMSDLSKYMNDENARKEIMSQAESLLELPEIQLSTNAYNKFYMPYINSMMLDAQIGNGYNIINKDLQYSAENADASFGAEYDIDGKVFAYPTQFGAYTVVTDKGLHSRMFGKNGQLISKEEYNKLLQKREEDIVNTFKYDAFPLWKWEEKGGSPGIWGRTVDSIRDRVRVENEEMSYENNLERILMFYNDPEKSKGVDKISILGKTGNFFREESGNLGGGIQAVPQKIKFNLSKKGMMDENKNTKPEVEEFWSVLGMVVDNPSVIKIGKGSVNTAQGNLPGEESFFQTSNDFTDVGKKLITKMYDDIIEKSESGKEMPYGEIQFQDIVAGGDKYHAYTINFNKEFLNDYAGTKDAPGLIYNTFKDLNADGFTIYVPADISEKSTKFGETSRKYKINANSGINAILNTVGEYNLNIPGAGSLRMVKDKEKNIITINGTKRIFNPNTMDYDEEKITDQVVENANVLDLFGIYKRVLDELKYGFYSNNMMRENMLKAQNLK